MTQISSLFDRNNYLLKVLLFHVSIDDCMFGVMNHENKHNSKQESN